MAWEWSHSDEAYENVRDTLYAMDAEKLVEIMGEWLAYYDKRISDQERQRGEPANFRRSDKRLAYWTALCAEQGTEHIAEKIYEYASCNATCDNGGFDMWVCPYGCHTVPASPEICDEDL